MMTLDSDDSVHDKISNSFNAACRAVYDLFSERIKTTTNRSSIDRIQQPRSVHSTGANYETNLKFVLNEILPNSTPTSTPPIQDIIDFYTKDTPDLIDESVCTSFPFCEDLGTHDTITIDELNMANKSARGSDKITQNDWTLIDTDHSFLLRVFNLILLHNCIPNCWM